MRILTFRCNYILKFEFGDLKRSRYTGEDSEIVLCGYITMKMNSDDKFNVVIMADVFAGANSEQPAEIPRVPHTPRLLKWRSQRLLENTF